MKSCSTEEIPFGAVISLINRSKYVFLNNRLRPLGLSAGQFPVLVLLAKEQNLMQEDLVRHYRLDKGTIARAVKKLEDRGYIRRITDPGNRRAVRLFLTEKGEDAVPHLHTINREWENLVSAGLSAEERTIMHRLMKRVAQDSLALLQKTGDTEND
jgi:MarR family transcriptional regulator, temperature-dependent positive regulator of motility